MAENFPNKSRMCRVPNKMNPKRPTLRRITTKMPEIKDKERILKAAKEKQLVTYKGALVILSANFSIETYRQEGTGTNYSKW